MRDERSPLKEAIDYMDIKRVVVSVLVKGSRCLGRYMKSTHSEKR